jgi:hypothetical protein
MNFASYDFWKLLILCFVGSRLILAAVRVARPTAEVTIAKLCLLATALILLASESTLTLVAFLWVVILGWICVLLRDSHLPIRLKHLVYLNFSSFFPQIVASDRETRIPPPPNLASCSHSLNI